MSLFKSGSRRLVSSSAAPMDPYQVHEKETGLTFIRAKRCMLTNQDRLAPSAGLFLGIPAV